ncbi:MAG: type II secretion system protein [Candidatus Omnitrophota bacterium]|jgi:prepilin-type N-terminal cleavage/methylation domain-containing protein
MKREGFSLIEMVVCASIVSVIAAGLMSVFFSGVRIWKRAAGGDFSAMEAALETEKISKELRQCFPLFEIGCSGKKEELTFPAVSAKGRVVRVTYRFDQEGKKFTRLETDYASILSEDEEIVERDISCFSGFSAEYRGFDKESQLFFWQDTWDKSLGLFNAVKLTFQVGDEELSKIVFIPKR